MIRKTYLVYAVLAAAWLLIAGWQAVEHKRLRNSARTALINRAQDISSTLGLVMRSQRRFGGVISKDRMESALNALVKLGDVKAIALLNDAGDVVASSGQATDLKPGALASTGELWGDRTVTLMNLVDLGTNVTQEVESGRTPIVLPREEIFPGFGTNRAPPPRRPRPEADPSSLSDVKVELNPNPPPPPADTNRPPRQRSWAWLRGGGDGRPPLGRPPWMSEAEYKEALEKKGVHSFVIVLSTQSMDALTGQDFWLRSIICILAATAAGGLALARLNLGRSAELELRLVRASELNTHLRQMNLAVAGLAHETRNPLNIIRGLAQMISKQPDASSEIHQQSQEIIEEADRVTVQLNEFINYSRPREVHRSHVQLAVVAGEVVRALTFDIEEKAVRLDLPTDLPVIEADEQLLRQALFNLLLNAIQAVANSGRIQLVWQKLPPQEITLEVRDDGPGVPPDQRSDIFKPYFTTHQKGTGLGLAVVQQIVLAHGWDIECLGNEPRGAIFRLSHLKHVPGA